MKTVTYKLNDDVFSIRQLDHDTKTVSKVEIPILNFYSMIQSMVDGKSPLLKVEANGEFSIP